MRIFTTSLAVLYASVCFGVSAFAQSPAAANPVAAGVRTAWESGKRNLTRNPGNDGPQGWGAAWSPDGRKITFVSDRDGTYEVYVMNADGSGQRRLTHRGS